MEKFGCNHVYITKNLEVYDYPISVLKEAITFKQWELPEYIEKCIPSIKKFFEDEEKSKEWFDNNRAETVKGLTRCRCHFTKEFIIYPDDYFLVDAYTLELWLAKCSSRLVYDRRRRCKLEFLPIAKIKDFTPQTVRNGYWRVPEVTI